MRRIDIIKRAGRNLRQAKARTALTALAMSVGAFTIGLALMLGNGGRAFLTSVIDSAGSASTVYVTHDQVEAMTLGDRVAVLKDGVLQQVAAPRELYDRPVNMFVAGFIGSPAMNLFPGVVFGREVIMGVRPADMWVGVGPSAAASISGTVVLVEELGSERFVHVRAAGDVMLVARAKQSPPVGCEIQVGFDPDMAHLFDPISGIRV